MNEWMNEWFDLHFVDIHFFNSFFYSNIFVLKAKYHAEKIRKFFLAQIQWLKMGTLLKTRSWSIFQKSVSYTNVTSLTNFVEAELQTCLMKYNGAIPSENISWRSLMILKSRKWWNIEVERLILNLLSSYW